MLNNKTQLKFSNFVQNVQQIAGLKQANIPAANQGQYTGNHKKFITAEKEKEIVDRLTKPRMNRFCECCAHKYGGMPHVHHS